jgi:hypothetical protein
MERTCLQGQTVERKRNQKVKKTKNEMSSFSRFFAGLAMVCLVLGTGAMMVALYNHGQSLPDVYQVSGLNGRECVHVVNRLPNGAITNPGCDTMKGKRFNPIIVSHDWTPTEDLLPAVSGR